MKKIVIALSVCIFAIGCSQKENESLSRRDTISPGHARIAATVIEIDSTLDSNNNKPCGKVPCYAEVRIDSVLGYGSAFGNPLVKASTIRLKFMYTLEETTKDLFPNSEKQFPGLEVGSAFQGDVQSIDNSNMNNSKGNLYKIFGYRLLN